MSAHRLIACVAALALVPGGCRAGDAPMEPMSDECPEPSAGESILFIGNSLTARNNLPGMVAALSVAAGDAEPLEVGAVVASSTHLGEHWEGGEAVRSIECGIWSVVTLQQGPSSLPENQEHLRRWSERFAEPIRAHGGEPALYMVWPARNRLSSFDAVSESYRNAAAAVDGWLFPVGEAWREAWRRDPDLELYGPDGYHPTSAGTYAAAVVIYAQLAGRSPIGLPRDLGPVAIPAPVAAVIQAAAETAIERFAAAPGEPVGG